MPFPSALHVLLLQVTHKIVSRRLVEGRKKKRKDNKMFYASVPAGDFSVVQRQINHTSGY